MTELEILQKKYSALKTLTESQEKMISELTRIKEDYRVQSEFLSEILEDIGEMVKTTEGYLWYQDEYYDSLRDLLHLRIGIEWDD